jgi:hypothetical protein
MEKFIAEFDCDIEPLLDPVLARVSVAVPSSVLLTLNTVVPEPYTASFTSAVASVAVPIKTWPDELMRSLSDEFGEPSDVVPNIRFPGISSVPGVPSTSDLICAVLVKLLPSYALNNI